ncbi:MAG: transglutaminase domain-containing protein [Reichenbachiella sp.]
MIKTALFYPLIWALYLISSELYAQNTYTVIIDRDYQFQHDADSLWIMSFLPKSITNRQRVINYRFSPVIPPIEDIENSRCFRLVLFDDEIKKSYRFHAEFDIEIFDYDLAEALYIKDGLDDTLNLSQYLEPESFINSDRKKFKKLVSTFDDSEIIAVRQIMEYVRKKINYKIQQYGDLGANKSLALREGDCSEYSDLMVSICRAKGIPSRTAIGKVAQTSINPNHAWVEAYLKGIGWVPFDPTAVESSGLERIEELTAPYIYYSFDRIDKYLGSFTANSWYYTNGTTDAR